MVRWAWLGVLAVALVGCASESTAPPAANGAAVTTGSTTPTTSASSAVALYDAACAGNIHPKTLSVVKPDDLTEISGVVVSRANSGVLWVHNDSGGRPEAYALSASGDRLGTFRVSGATNTDWEDIALGPGPTPNTDHLYLGDIGDNAVARPNITVYRMPEPRVGATGATSTAPAGTVETFTLTYPDGPHNAEAMVVDPVSGQLVIVTKENDAAHIFTAPAAKLTDGATLTLEASGDLERGSSAGSGLPSLVTGADISVDGTVVAVRTYSAVLLYRRAAGQTVAEALASVPCDANAAIEGQGESVGIAPDGQSYFTLPEGTNTPIHQATIG